MAQKTAAKGKKSSAAEYLNRLEPVLLVKDNHNYKDDVTVTYNGVNYQIQRGKQVMVPKFLKLIIEESYRQQMAAADFSANLSEYFEQKTKQLG
ncbi:MAG: hypothetical protein HFI90_11135 [Clostridia bacterium]|nr:hypothetical protein [Clostridia bacterium]